MVLRGGSVHVKPFNGSDAMLSIRESIDEGKAAGPHLAILTVRVASDFEWTQTITIPFFFGRP